MESKHVYLAGGLFDLRQMAGNAALAAAIEAAAEGRYSVYLPQDHEPTASGTKAIRDSDFEALLASDAAVFQFDGPELDSGTVVEFMAAKFAELPSVLLRTDFRRAGDRNEEPWNLMCSFYPRTVSLVTNAMDLYLESGHSRSGGVAAREEAFVSLGRLAVEKLDGVSALEPLGFEEGMDPKERLRRLLGM